MFFDIKVITFGGIRMLRSLGIAFSPTIVVLLPHITLSHLSIHLATQMKDLFGNAFLPNRSCQVERPKYVRLPEVHDGRSAIDP